MIKEQIKWIKKQLSIVIIISFSKRRITMIKKQSKWINKQLSIVKIISFSKDKYLNSCSGFIDFVSFENIDTKESFYCSLQIFLEKYSEFTERKETVLALAKKSLKIFLDTNRNIDIADLIIDLIESSDCYDIWLEVFKEEDVIYNKIKELQC